MPDFLPEPLPDDPFPLYADWLHEATSRRITPNPDAMVLATTSTDCQPSARVVLCKSVVVQPGYVVFYTNYRSRKGLELEAVPHAAAVVHWDVLGRQVRLEGQIVKSPSAESDAYFASRPLASRIGAWGSRQSEFLLSRAALAEQIAAAARRFGVTPETTMATVPRPSHWGGYRLWPAAIELWVEGPGRVHDRARWTRQLQPADPHTFTTGPWQAARLHP